MPDNREQLLQNPNNVFEYMSCTKHSYTPENSFIKTEKDDSVYYGNITDTEFYSDQVSGSNDFFSILDYNNGKNIDINSHVNRDEPWDLICTQEPKNLKTNSDMFNITTGKNTRMSDYKIQDQALEESIDTYLHTGDLELEHLVDEVIQNFDSENENLQNIYTQINLNNQKENIVIGNQSENTNNGQETEECFFTNEYLQQYLIKDKYNENIHNSKEDKLLLEQIKKYLNIDHILLNETQKKMIDIIGTKVFPRKFKPYMFNTNCSEYKISFMYLQASKYRKLISQETKSLHSIPVFIPNYLRIHKDDSAALVEFKIQALMNLKINYVSYYRFFKCSNASKANSIPVNDDNKYQDKFLLICADKIEDIDKPEIFVFIPDDCFDKNMQLIKRISHCNIKPIFFEKFIRYPQFEFGCYEFVSKDGDYVYMRDNQVGSRWKMTQTNQITDDIIIYELEKFKDKVKANISKINNRFLNQNTQHNIISTSKRKLEDGENTNQQRKKIRRNHYFNADQNKLSTRHKSQQAFKDIENKIFTKYEEIVNDSIDLKIALTEECNFNKSELSHIFDIKLINEIKKNIKTKIKYDYLRKSHNVLILIPMKYYLYDEDTASDRDQKQQKLAEAEIVRYHCAYLSQTRKGYIDTDPDNNKIVAALTQQINIQDAFNDDKIIILMCNEPTKKYDKSANVNLFDPNKFVSYGYFYNNVKIHSNQVNNYLYEFFIHPKFNKHYKDYDIHRINYIAQIPNIDEMTLIEYLKQAYKAFDKRMKIRAQEFQFSCREKPIS